MKKKINIKFKNEVKSFEIKVRDKELIEIRKSNPSTVYTNKKKYNRKRLKEIDYES